MADSAAGRGRGRGRGREFGRGRGDGRGRGRGRGDGRGRGRGRGRRGDGEGRDSWTPVTKAGRLVKAGYIKKIEELYLFSIPIKEYQIVDHFLPDLKDDVIRMSPVQKQTSAGQRTRFKAYVVVGDCNGHVGVGNKCAKEVATAIRVAIEVAKLAVVPVRRGYWGNNIGMPHTIPMKLTGKCGSVRLRLVPAPRGAGIVAAPVSKKILQYAGIEDVYTASQGSTKTGGNFAMATFDAVRRSYGYLTPDMWKQTAITNTPYQEFSEFLASTKKY